MIFSKKLATNPSLISNKTTEEKGASLTYSFSQNRLVKS